MLFGENVVALGRLAEARHASSSGKDTRIVLVDAHPVFLMGLAACLANGVRLSVIGTASRASAGVAMIANLRPDVAVVDLLLADGSSGLDLARAVSALRPQPKVLLLSGVAEPDPAELVAAGVHGYLSKTAECDQIATAVTAIANGINLVPAGLPTQLSQTRPLTARERRVLDLVSQGCRNADIAAQLKISVNTVEYYISRLFMKLGVHSRWQLIARRRGAVLAIATPLPVKTAARSAHTS